MPNIVYDAYSQVLNVQRLALQTAIKNKTKTTFHRLK